MLSRVADSLYWMSRYFERADNASRVLKATYGLILNPAKFSTEERWFHAVSSLAPGAASNKVDPQHALFLLVADPEGAFSIVKCIKRRPRKRPPGSRRNQLRDVGAPQSAFSRRDRRLNFSPMTMQERCAW